MSTPSDIDRRLERIWKTPEGLWGWLSTVDHKEIGLRYIVTAFVFLLIGGIEALAIRWQLGWSNRTAIGPEAYDQLFSLHGITMIYWYAAPILSGFANYLIPLMIGARDMAFPRLNAFSYWTYLLSGIFALFQPDRFAGAACGLVFVRTLQPHALFARLRHGFHGVALLLLTISTTVGAINFFVTIFTLRAPGMAINKMPLFLYSTMTISAAIVFSLPALTVGCVFLELDRQWGFHFFDPTREEWPLLWQQLFWFFGHPWVYVVFLPATGMISMLASGFQPATDRRLSLSSRSRRC